MAIKGLTGQGRSFDEIGKLRKGGPKRPVLDEQGQPELDKYGKPKMGYGNDLDHFRFDSDDADAIAKFRAEFGEAPKSVRVMLPYPTTEENFMTAMERYGAGGIEIRCDREWKSGVMARGRFMKCFPGKVACDSPDLNTPCPSGCKQVGRLKLIIPALERFVYVTSETHSINDIVRLDKQLADIEHHFGRCNGIPLVLTRRLISVSTPNGKGRARRPKWLLSLEVSPEWSRLQLQSRQNLAFSEATIAQLGQAPQQTMALPAAPFDTTARDLRPEPPPSYDFTQGDLWLKIKNAFQTANDAQAIQDYEARAIARVEDGSLPPHARTMIANLVDRAYQKLSDRQPPYTPQNGNSASDLRSAAPPEPQPTTSPPVKKTVQINAEWKKSQLWVDLNTEVMRAAIDELPDYQKQVEKLIANDELPAAAGTEMVKLCGRRAANLQPLEPAVSAKVEVIND